MTQRDRESLARERMAAAVEWPTTCKASDPPRLFLPMCLCAFLFGSSSSGSSSSSESESGNPTAKAAATAATGAALPQASLASLAAPKLAAAASVPPTAVAKTEDAAPPAAAATPASTAVPAAAEPEAAAPTEPAPQAASPVVERTSSSEVRHTGCREKCDVEGVRRNKTVGPPRAFHNFCIAGFGAQVEGAEEVAVCLSPDATGRRLQRGL